jgi:hypothetical protein
MMNSTWAYPPSGLSPSGSKPVGILWNSALRDGSREALAGADIRRREIHLHPCLRDDPDEYSRVLTHELFHFAWVRLGNPRRAEWKALLQVELAAGARGELGWSSEWRKQRLPARFAEYACESFCDTAAWLYSTCRDHEEYTLAVRWRTRRKAWFDGLPPLPY